MHPQSSAYKLLVHHYRLLRRRMQMHCRAARWQILAQRRERLQVEMLQPRLMMSVVPSGSETLVNTTTSGNQYMPTVAMDRAGASVVVWTTSKAVDGQRFDASGNPTGGEFQINVNTVGNYPHPSVAMDNAGDFVVSWNSGSSVYARLYNSAGSALTGETLVASNKVGLSPSCVAMTPAGGFMVVWEGNGSQDSDGIYAQQFAASGLASGSALLVNTTTAGVQTNPQVAADVNGNYAVAWTDQSAGSKVKAVYLPASGMASSEIVVGGSATDTEDQPSVGFDGPGNFIVAWDETAPSFGVFSRRYHPGGTAIDAAPVLVSSWNGAAQTGPAVAVRLDGSYLISWTDTGGHDGNGYGIFAQAYTATGAPDGGEFGVNTTTTGTQQNTDAAWMGGTAAVVWEGKGVGDPSGIFLQRYTASQPADQAPVNGVPNAQSITENNPLTFSTANGNAISVSDADAYGAVEQVTLSVTTGALSIANTSGITIVSGAASGGGAVSFTGTIANLNAALNGLVFTPANNNLGTATLQIVTNDLGNTGTGGPLSTTNSFSIQTNPPANPANNVIPGSQTTALNTPLVFMPANGNQLSVGSSWQDVQLIATNGTLTLSTTSGLSFSSGTGSGDTSMEFSGSQSAMNDALNGLIFTPTPGYTGSAQVQVTTIIPALLGLLFGSSSTSNIPVTVTAAPVPNQAPTVSVPAGQAIDQNTALVFAGSSANAISVADADANGGSERVTLTATSGSITLSGTSGLTFSPGSGPGNPAMTFTGTLASINAALNGLTFSPAQNFVGTGGIDISIDDLGNTGTGGAKMTSGSVAITMYNNAPTVAAIAAASPSSVTGTTTALSALGADDGGESNLTYTWSTTGTLPAAVSFSPNSTNAAKNCTARFTKAGTYDLQVTVTDAEGLSATSDVAVTVVQTPTSIGVTPSSAALVFNAAQQYSATSLDQFGNPMASQPAFSWAVTSGAGSVNGAGLYSAPASATTATVTASAGGLSASGSAAVVQTLVVNTTSDVADGNTSSDAALIASPGADGVISLREAILAANNTAGTTLIQFNIGGGGLQTIALTSVLPAITAPVIIDGTSQPSFTGAPLIELSGSGAGATTNGLTIAAGTSTVRGLVIDSFGGNGIELTANGNDVIQGNYIGTDATGTLARPNGRYGIDIASGTGDTIGGTAFRAGNVVSGNALGGIQITGGSFLVSEDNNVVRIDSQTGAVLATYPTGLANDSVAVGSDGSFYVPDYYNNVVRRYDAAGVLISTFGTGHLSSPQDVIFGPDGNLYVGNVGGGIQKFSPTGTFLATFVANGAGGLNNTKGMVFGPDGNLYVANLTNSDVIQFNGTTGALMRTFVASGSGGLSGPEDLAFGPDGNLYVTDYFNNAVYRYSGSTGASLGTFVSGGSIQPYGIRFDAAGNLDVAYRSPGVIRTYDGHTGAFLHALVTGLTNPAWFTATPAPSGGDVIQGNYIGTDASGTAALGNHGDGILADGRANVVGGAGAANVIAFNAGDGVDVTADGQVAVTQNSIYGNNGFGIDLTGGVATANTGAPNAAKPNDGMNYPVVTRANLSSGQLAVAGYIGSAPGQTSFANATVEIFKSDASAGSASGRTYLGTLTADISGSFSGTLSGTPLATGDEVTATATDTSGNTSQFATNLVVNTPPTVATAAAASPSPVTGTTASLSVLGADDGGERNLIYTWVTTGTPPAKVKFLDNAENSAKNCRVMFHQAGNYDFKVTITDAEGLSVTSSLTVTVSQTLTSIVVNPSTVSLDANQQQQFTATGFDQFDQPMSPQPQFTWTVSSGAGSISSTGLYTAPSGQSSDTVTASSGSISSSVFVAVRGYPVVTLSGGASSYTEGQSAVAVDPQLTVADPGSGTLAGAMIQLIGYVPAQDVLNLPSGSGITATWDSSIGTLSLTGTATVAQYQDALRSVTYINTSDDPAVSLRTAQITVTDGTLSSTPVNRNIALTAVNNPPAIAGPGAQVTTEDVPLQFSSAGGDVISVSDPDANGAAEQISLNAADGTVTLAQTSGLTFSAGNGTSGVSVMTFTGTLADMNAALDGMTFTPLAGYVGPASIQATADDLGNTGIGGALTDTHTFNIAVEAPAGISISPTSGLSTADDGTTANFSVVLNRPPTADVTIGLQTSDPAAGMPTVDSLTFTPADWNVAQDVTVVGFDDTATSATQIPYQIRTVPARSADPLYAGVNGPDVHLTDVKLPPVVQASAGVAQYLAGSRPVVVDSGITVQGPAADIAGATVTFTAGYVNGQDNLSISPIGGIKVKWQPGAGRLVLSGRASAATYQSILQSVSYVNASQSPQLGSRSIEFALTNDGGTASATRMVQVAAGNEPPSIVAPPTQQTDSVLIFSQANQNGITVIDPAIADAPVQVTLTARKGSLTLPNSSGVAFTLGGTSGSLSVQFVGTVNDANAALEGLQFTPFKGYNGLASLRIDVNDLGNTSAGVPQSANAVVPIAVQAPAPATPGPAVPPTVIPAPPAVPPPWAFAPPGGLVVSGPVTLTFQAPGTYSGSGGSSSNGISPGGTGQTAPIETIVPGADGSTPGANGGVPAGPRVKPTPAAAATPKEATPAPAQRPTQSQGPQAAAAARPQAAVSGPKLVIGAGSIGMAVPAGGGATSVTVVPADVQAVLSNQSPMWEQREELHKNLVEENRARLVAGTATFVSVGASVLYFAWLLRAGSLVSSLLSSMPAWSFVDPLPILDQMDRPIDDEDDEESLQSMVE